MYRLDYFQACIATMINIIRYVFNRHNKNTWACYINLIVNYPISSKDETRPMYFIINTLLSDNISFKYVYDICIYYLNNMNILDKFKMKYRIFKNRKILYCRGMEQTPNLYYMTYRGDNHITIIPTPKLDW